MKQIFFLVLCVVLGTDGLFANTADSLFRAGNKAYADKDYATALENYSQITRSNIKSAAVFYNMGNAYFRTQNIGKAILYYEKALRLDPHNKDIQTNLKVANARVKDDLIALEPFFLQRWITGFTNLFSSNGWSVIFSICLFSTLSLLFLFLGKTFFYRQKLIFILLCVSFVLCTVSLWAAIHQRNEVLKHNEAIIMQPELHILSSPDETSNEVLFIHEGQKVIILDRLEDRIKVRTINGQAGWIKNSAVEII